MFDELSKSIKASLYDRTVSPLFGAFAVSWAVWNYRLLLVILAAEPVTKKFRIIDETLYPSIYAKFGFLLMGPLITAVIFLFVYPYPAKFVYRFWRTQKRDLRSIRQKIEDETLLSVEESREIRRQLVDIQLDHEKELNLKRGEIDTLRSALAENQEKLENAEKALESPQRFGNASITQEPIPKDELVSAIIGRKYRLYFNPAKGPEASKEMLFGKDGSIEIGRNDNEHTWRLTDEFLELVQKDGRVHSRFRYDSRSRIFNHTNDKDTLSIKGQYIIPV